MGGEVCVRAFLPMVHFALTDELQCDHSYGGKSSRMGSDNAWLEIDGKHLLEHQIIKPLPEATAR